jgi:hypothetical protein
VFSSAPNVYLAKVIVFSTITVFRYKFIFLSNINQLFFQKYHSECGSVMAVWRYFRVVVLAMSSANNTRTPSLGAVAQYLQGKDGTLMTICCPGLKYVAVDEQGFIFFLIKDQVYVLTME